MNQLAARERSALAQLCTRQPLHIGDILHHGGAPIEQVYFPLSGYVSLLAEVAGTPPLEVGMVGREGVLGAQLALGVRTGFTQALVQGEGEALRVPARPFARHLAASPALQRCLGRYLHVRMQQLAGIAPCLRFHPIEARLARWLLMSQDRAGVPAFAVKQEFLSYMLGVRRASITTAALALKGMGVIAYARGRLTVLDRPGLEAAACACYAADSACYAAQLGTSFPADTSAGNS